MEEAPYQPTDRRPIAARRWRIWNSVVAWMARRGVSPNGISLAGMLFGVTAGAALAATAYVQGWERIAWLAAAVFIQLRLLANLLDGMVAIKSGKASPVGELFNDFPDRVSDAAVIVGAGYSLGGDVVLGYLAANVAVFTAYVRVLGKATGATQHYCGPMAKPQRMALLTILSLFCAIAPAEWQAIPGDLANRGVMSVGLLIIIFGGIATAIRRLFRIANDLRRGTP